MGEKKIDELTHRLQQLWNESESAELCKLTSDLLDWLRAIKSEHEAELEDMKRISDENAAKYKECHDRFDNYLKQLIETGVSPEAEELEQLKAENKRLKEMSVEDNPNWKITDRVAYGTGAVVERWTHSYHIPFFKTISM